MNNRFVTKFFTAFFAFIAVLLFSNSFAAAPSGVVYFSTSNTSETSGSHPITVYYKICSSQGCIDDDKTLNNAAPGPYSIDVIIPPDESSIPSELCLSHIDFKDDMGRSHTTNIVGCFRNGDAVNFALLTLQNAWRIRTEKMGNWGIDTIK